MTSLRKLFENALTLESVVDLQAENFRRVAAKHKLPMALDENKASKEAAEEWARLQENLNLCVPKNTEYPELYKIFQDKQHPYFKPMADILEATRLCDAAKKAVDAQKEALAKELNKLGLLNITKDNISIGIGGANMQVGISMPYAKGRLNSNHYKEKLNIFFGHPTGRALSLTTEDLAPSKIENIITNEVRAIEEHIAKVMPRPVQTTLAANKVERTGVTPPPKDLSALFHDARGNQETLSAIRKQIKAKGNQYETMLAELRSAGNTEAESQLHQAITRFFQQTVHPETLDVSELERIQENDPKIKTLLELNKSFDKARTGLRTFNEQVKGLFHNAAGVTVKEISISAGGYLDIALKSTQERDITITIHPDQLNAESINQQLKSSGLLEYMERIPTQSTPVEPITPPATGEPVTNPTSETPLPSPEKPLNPSTLAPANEVSLEQKLEAELEAIIHKEIKTAPNKDEIIGLLKQWKAPQPLLEYHTINEEIESALQSAGKGELVQFRRAMLHSLGNGCTHAALEEMMMANSAFLDENPNLKNLLEQKGVVLKTLESSPIAPVSAVTPTLEKPRLPQPTIETSPAVEIPASTDLENKVKETAEESKSLWAAMVKRPVTTALIAVPTVAAVAGLGYWALKRNNRKNKDPQSPDRSPSQ